MTWLSRLVSRIVPPIPSIAPLTQQTIDVEYRRQRKEVEQQLDALIDLANAQAQQRER